ncbi:hypothetical protein GGG16DRAFT_88538 [Schizophyllum commune]
MQSARPAGNGQPPVKIYNAVYSSVQVYECMIRGIAVMRRRADSYVNATQILKVAGVDKGRRTKILEKEILPGTHEIVQGGYGKYQGTWIPLDRGRSIAAQYGVAPLLAPLFDFTPSTNSLAPLPVGGYMPPMPSSLAPPPIMPGSALRLLNQGRAQGLFTPSTSGMSPSMGRPGSGFNSPIPYSSSFTAGQSPFSASSQTPPPAQSLKRHRSEADVDGSVTPTQPPMSSSQPLPLDAPIDIQMSDARTEPDDGPSPTKRARKEPSPAHTNGVVSSRPESTAPASTKASSPQPPPGRHPRLASPPVTPQAYDPTLPLKGTRRHTAIARICQVDDPGPVLEVLHELSPAAPGGGPAHLEPDVVLDEKGHNALHIASALVHTQTIRALLDAGADVHRGNHLGETPLIRACLSTQAYDGASMDKLLEFLHPSIRTLDTSRKSVLHHIVALAGVVGRSPHARYYLDALFTWIAKREDGDYKSFLDLQDEHGDTALNIAARVGNRSLVRTLLDVGANRTLPNKLGLRPGDFGIETEELSVGKSEDILAGLRAGPPVPVQKAQDVIADMTAMIQALSADFQAEIKAKQDSLDLTQAHLRAGTRSLAEQRKTIAATQARCAEREQIAAKVRSVQRAFVDEDGFDWTGRDTDPSEEGSSAMDVDSSAKGKEKETKSVMSSAFIYRGRTASIAGLPAPAHPAEFDADPPLPAENSAAALVRMRRMRMWHERMEGVIQARMDKLKGAGAEKEVLCRRIVALCTGTPVEEVEERLGDLLIALESESQVIDVARVSGFLQKVRDGQVG